VTDGDVPPASVARCVLGDVEAPALGRVDYHEHLFQTSRLLVGDELDDEARSTDEARSLQASGFDSMVDATPIGLGGDPDATARASANTGLHIVATTGAHREAHYDPSYWLLQASAAELARRFEDDLTIGMPNVDGRDQTEIARGPSGEPVRAGMLKAGIGYWSISAFEQRVLEAVSVAHHHTNAPVMVHLEHGSAAFEVLDILHGHGVGASAVVLAHIDRNPDPVLHAELAARGAYLGYDGPARSQRWPDSVVLDALVQAAARGAAERIVLGGDVARRTRYRAYGGMPGLAYLGERFVPRLIEQGGAALASAILQENPQRLLARFIPGSSR
jgi:predicted metal-dependent phosphotriesterase family hydrolase